MRAVIALAVLLLFLTIRAIRRSRRDARLPPGPPGLPILGELLILFPNRGVLILTQCPGNAHQLPYQKSYLKSVLFRPLGLVRC